MPNFPPLTPETATAEGKTALERAKNHYGFIPNLLGVMAEAPAALDAYLSMSKHAMQTSFTPTERNVVWFALNFENNCHYCMAAHTAGAKGGKIAEDVIETARKGGDYADAKLQALKVFTLKMRDQQGWVSEDDIHAFLEAGCTKQQVFEVIVILAQKVLSNYVNHIANTPLDDVFKPFKWKKPAAL